MNRKNGLGIVELTDVLFEGPQSEDSTLRRAYGLAEIMSVLMELNGTSSAQADHMAGIFAVLF